MPADDEVPEDCEMCSTKPNFKEGDKRKPETINKFSLTPHSQCPLN